MSQAGPIDVIASNPQIPTQFPTDDGTAIPLANTLEILGKKTSGDVPTMFTLGSGNTVEIENRTWQTAYVVDQNTTPGDRATFSTIQSAIDAAVGDGNTSAVIFIRNGVYSENLSITTSIMLTGFRPQVMEPFQNDSKVSITGTITVSGNANPTFNNINIGNVNQTNTNPLYAFGCTFTSITSTGNVNLSNCIITGTGSTFTRSSKFRYCSFVTNGTCLTFSSSGQTLTLQNCIATTISPGCTITINNTSLALITNCTNLIINGNTTGIVSVQNTTLYSPLNLTSADLRINGLSFSPQGTGSELITTVPNTLYPSSEGNISSRRIVTTTGNITARDQYVGCRQSGNITLTLSGTFIKGQKITIADESGNASTNNVTVSGTINGGASVVIAQNYGSITLIYDGTNWFTDPDSSTNDITAISGDSGSISGTTVTLYANRAAKNAGSSVSFTNSGSTSTFNTTDATNNTFLGKNSGTTTVSGANNSAQGFNSMPAISSGDSNCGLGSTCFENLTTGNQNVGLGVISLQNITSGSGNVGIGHASGANYTSSESSNIVLQNPGVNGESNTMRLGSTGVGSKQVDRAFIAATFGTTVGGSGIPVVIDSSEQLGTVVSSKRFKENIEDLKEISSRILELRPVVFNYIKNKERGYGLIAEEVQEIMPELVVKNQLDELVTVKYLDLPVMILNELQKLVKRVEDLERKIK